MKKLLKNILIAIVSIGTIYAWVQAWTGLIAVDWDALDYTKWNELVNKVLPIESDATKVWIGTTPDTTLHVARDSAEIVKLENTAAAGWSWQFKVGGWGWFDGDFMIVDKTGGADDHRFRIDSTTTNIKWDLTVTGSIDATPVVFLWKWPGNPYQIGGGNPAIWTQDINLWWFTLQNGGTEVKVPSDGYYRIHAMMHLKDDPADAGWTWLWISKNGSNSTQSLYPTNSNWATHHLTNIMYLTTTDIVTIPYAGTREAGQQFSKLIIEKLN